jgi:hypothetical protein
MINAIRQRNLTGARHQKSKRDRLRIAIRELRIVRFRKEELPPVLRQIGEALVAARHLLDDLVAQQAAEPGAYLRKLFRRARRNRAPAKEIADEWQERVGRFELRARRLHIALTMNHLAGDLAVLPQAEAVAVRVEEVRE